jgi:hypothetical protein
MLIATGKEVLTVSMATEQLALGVSEKEIPVLVFQLALALKVIEAEAFAAAAAETG